MTTSRDVPVITRHIGSCVRQRRFSESAEWALSSGRSSQQSAPAATYERHSRMSVWHDLIRRLEQHLAECRKDLELLESGQMQHRERRDGGAWVDTTQREI